MVLYMVIAGIVLSVLFSAFFSAAEMSFSSLNSVRLENDAKDGKRGAKVALKVSEHFDDALSAILIGNNLFNIAASSLTTVLVILIFGDDKLNAAATAILTVVIIIFGETIPKITAKKSANGFAVIFGWLVRFFMIIFYPVVKLSTNHLFEEEEVIGLAKELRKPEYNHCLEEDLPYLSIIQPQDSYRTKVLLLKAMILNLVVTLVQRIAEMPHYSETNVKGL